MPIYPVPNSPEWLAALESFNPKQAATTRLVLKSAGREDVCSICGDDPAVDLRRAGDDDLPDRAVASIRLCADCRKLRQMMHGESYQPL